jgi:hypothetical protein
MSAPAFSVPAKLYKDQLQPHQAMSISQLPEMIPMRIVSFNRSIMLSGILLAALLQQPLITTVLFLLVAPSVLFGKKASLIFLVGSKLFPGRKADEAVESPQLMRFNNAIAALLLGGAQVAFLSGAAIAGWVLCGMVATAAAVALCGFCLGCFLYFQFNMQRYRFFGRKANAAIEL